MSELLERDEAESELHRALARARVGDGGLVLVTGEAGMGKTTLVRAFLERAAGAPTVLQGACDPVEAPRPLGPLLDIAHDVDPALAARLTGGMPRAEAFGAALDLLDTGGGGVSVLVLEDMHWADEATLDLFTFLVRRLDRRRVLVVASYRSDEVDVRHPFRARLGDVTRHVHARIDLQPLSIEAIEQLASDADLVDIDATAVHRITGGNPFFVTEVLATSEEGRVVVPASVRDAVLARASRLPPEARLVLDAVSIVPGSAEPWMLDALIGDDADALTGLDICIARGLLRRRPNREVEFRHELARLAVAEVVEPAQRRALDHRALDALERQPGAPDHARIALHAAAAGAGETLLAHAPLAAEQALASGGSREAVELIEASLRYGHTIDSAGRGALWQTYGLALSLAARFADALDAFERAIVEFADAGDRPAQAEAHARCTTPLWGLARQPEAIERLRQADALLGDDPAPTSHVAYVAGEWCGNMMLARRSEEAERAGERAMAIAESIGDTETLATTAIERGISRCVSGDDSGLELIERGMAIAAASDMERFVAYGYSQIGSGYGELRRYDIAMPALHDGIDYKEAREYAARSLYDQAWLARCELETGDWASAGARAATVERNLRCVGNTRLVVLCTLGWLRSRRGDPGVAAILDEALDLARVSQHVQRLWPAAAARAEHAWIRGRLDHELDVVHEALSLAEEVAYRPAIEELSHWLSIADGHPRCDGDPEAVRTPFGLSAAGRWDLAAERWAEIGCPFEEAFARYMTGDADQVRAAHATFADLGAGPFRERAAERLRELGVRVPRGANRATRGNPHGLTDRELEVLAELASGDTNAAIGERLHISTKTVGHHVSSILSKLDVSSRAEAAVLADRLGI